MKKRRLLYFSLGTFMFVTACSFTSKSFDNASDKDKLLIDLINYVLNAYHFDPINFNDDSSKEIFEEFINTLDPFKRYFLNSDVEILKEKYYTEIDDQLKETDISFFNETMELYYEKIDNAKSVYTKVLAKPLKFNREEMLNVDYENMEYAVSKKELLDRWRKQLKFSALSNLNDKIDDIKSDGGKVPTDKAKLIKEAQEKTTKTMNEYYANVSDLDRDDWFAIFLNVLVERYDPHTYYFAPEDKDDFDISMSGKYEGIGARLQKLATGIKIIEIISGGPVWKGNLLDVGDKILKVGQKDEEPVDVTNMPLRKAVKLIKGAKGTKVYLTVKRVGGAVEVITIVRDEIELEETYIKSAIVEADNHNFGLINMPKFYVDFRGYEEYRNAASDMKMEIDRLAKNNVEGIVIDLRGNGGGSLKTAIDITGFFIKEGPVVQVRHSGNKIEVLEDEDSSILWDKPLVVMVDELSASASEILAAALQDYKRAIILGSKQTYGKGTVQNVVNLNQFVKNNNFGDIGSLKITTQKFYRINGGSTQLNGVESDIVMPDKYRYVDIGERDLDHAMPWDKIEEASYELWTDNHPIDFQGLLLKSEDRISKNNYLKIIDTNAKWLKEQQDKNSIPLYINGYQKKQQESEDHTKAFKKSMDLKTDVIYKSLPYEQLLFEKDSILKEKRKRWHNNLSKDIYIQEAVNILGDWLEQSMPQKLTQSSSK